MDEDAFEEAVEVLQKSVKFTVSDENKLCADDGSLLNTSGLFSYPKEITIDGVNVETQFKTTTRDAMIYADFTDSEGQEVSVRESGYGTDSVWEAYMESNAKNSPYECEIGGFPAKGYIYQELTSLTGNYILQIGEGEYYDVSVKFKGTLDAAALKAMMEGVGDRDELNQKMSAYADQFVASATKLDGGNAAE